jgi:DNA-binding PadR family transcriptional regulator
MSEREDQERREDCRLAVLEVMATRHPAAHHAAAIARILRRPIYGYDFNTAEVEQALHFLKSDGLVTSIADPLGASLAWQASSEGIRRWERRGNPS